LVGVYVKMGNLGRFVMFKWTIGGGLMDVRLDKCGGLLCLKLEMQWVHDIRQGGLVDVEMHLLHLACPILY
jgi:hypothetical protein